MKDEDFLFSLYPNDLIYIESLSPVSFHTVKGCTLVSKIERKEMLLYYRKAGISTASITVLNHDNTYVKESLGIKTIGKLQKCTVDILGNVHYVTERKKSGI